MNRETAFCCPIPFSFLFFWQFLLSLLFPSPLSYSTAFFHGQKNCNYAKLTLLHTKNKADYHLLCEASPSTAHDGDNDDNHDDNDDDDSPSPHLVVSLIQIMRSQIKT